MATLPAPAYLSNAARTEAEMKTAVEAVRDVIAQLLGGNAEATLTLATDDVTPGAEDSGRAKSVYAIDTEGAASTDNLAHVLQTNLPDGSLLLLHSANASRTVVVKHATGGAGQLGLADAADFSLTDPKMWLLLKRTGAMWEEIGRFYGPQKGAGRSFLGAAGLADENTFTKTQSWAKGADVASAATLALGTDGNSAVITGTTTITAISAKPVGALMALTFSGILTLTHHATNLILRNGVDHKTAAGDTLIFVSIGSGQWREIARDTKRLDTVKGGDLASASTVTPTSDGNYFHITGTTGISAIASLPAGTIVIFEFDGALTLTHNATSLILQGGGNLTTAPGDVVAFISEGAGNWRELFRRLASAPGAGGGFDAEAKSSFYEDFAGNYQNDSSGYTATNGGIAAFQAVEGGVIRIEGDGATLAGFISWGAGAAVFKAAKNPIIKLRWAQYGANTATRFIGLASANLTGAPTNGVYFRHTAGGNIIAVCRSGGAESTLDTAVAAANGTFRTGRLTLIGTTSCQVHIDGVSKGTIGTNIPSALLFPSAGNDTNTQGGYGLDIDLWEVVQDR